MLDTSIPPKCTFRPLARGRYRCNQTGKIVKARRTEAYRRSILLSGHQRPAPLKPAVADVHELLVGFDARYAHCPTCDSPMHIDGLREGTYYCDYQHKYVLKRALPKVRVWQEDRATWCPRCDERVQLSSSHESGQEVKCRYGHPFTLEHYR